MIDTQDAKKVAAMLSAVGEPTRMLILHRLAHGPQYVGQLSEALGVPMVNMSHHLGVMRQAGLLENSKDGRRVVYGFQPGVFTPGGKGSVGTLQLGTYRLVLFDGAGKGKPAKRPGKKK